LQGARSIKLVKTYQNHRSKDKRFIFKIARGLPRKSTYQVLSSAGFVAMPDFKQEIV
jgi:hypothetical protein